MTANINRSSVCTTPEPYADKAMQTGFNLSSLQQQARSNDAFSIDYLFTLAFENNHQGKAATSFLFDLYTGKEASPAGDVLREQLGKDSLKLYEIVQARNQLFPNDRWQVPAKILIMAGFETRSESQPRVEITRQLNEQQPLFCQMINRDDHPLDETIFDSNRFITAAELASATSGVNQQSLRVECHSALAITNNTDQIKTQFARLFSSCNAGDFVPLLYKDHWILLGLCNDDDGQKQSIIFDSMGLLQQEEIEHLEELAGINHTAGRLWFRENLQKHAPNACGLLVAKAMQALADNASQPVQALQRWKSEFSALNTEEKQLSNLRGRAELYGRVMDLSEKHC